jgi:hypothetical protein
MEGFSFVTPVTGLNRPNTGKEDDDEDLITLQPPSFLKKEPSGTHSRAPYVIINVVIKTNSLSSFCKSYQSIIRNFTEQAGCHHFKYEINIHYLFIIRN